MRKLIIVLTLFILGTSISNAQILRRIKKKVERKVEQKVEDRISKKVDEKVDEKIDQGLDSIFEKSEKDEEDDPKSNSDKDKERAERSSKSAKRIGALFGMSKPNRATYSFKGQVQMEITSESEKPIHFNYYFNRSENYYAMDMRNEENDSQTYMVFDDEQMVTFVDNDGSKSTFAFPTNMEDQMSDKMNPEENYDKSKLRKTGKTKKILGYLCYEYIMSDKEDNLDVTSWVAPSLDIPYKQDKHAKENPIQGFTLETNIKKDGKITNVLVTKIDLGKKLKINTADYNK